MIKDSRFTILISASAIILLITAMMFGQYTAASDSQEKPGVVQHIYNNTFGRLLKEGVKDVSQVRLVLVGDVMIGRTVETKTKELGDSAYSFRKVADRLNTADIVFANLENPIIANCPKHESGYKFCANPEMLDGLTYSGIDVVTLANNHTKNYGLEGLEETRGQLDSVNIDYVGIDNLVVKEVGGTTFGFLGFDYLSNLPKESDLELIRVSSDKVDVLVVGVHWGVEYKEIPNEFQRKWAREFVGAGADVIAGHHPHWVQEIEYISSDDKGSTFKGLALQGVPVYYSLGNFVFDQMWSEETKKGLVVELTFEDGVLVGEELVPTYMSSWAQPEWVE